MVVIEAMSSQLCVVAAAIGGVPEALGDAGLLFSPGNEQDLQEKLLMALKDGNLRQRLAENARNRATKLFSLSSIVGHFEDALDHVN
jgi:glycosyltransferase involved in cell wall biosynthesis